MFNNWSKRTLLALLATISLSFIQPAYSEISSSPIVELPVSSENTLKKEIVIAFVGDMHFEGKVSTAVNSGKDPFRYVKHIFQEADLVVGNLETAITQSSNKNIKQYNFKTKSSNLKYIADSNFTLLSIANNHTFDYLSQGFSDTLKALDQHNLRYIGGGHNFTDAHKGVVLPVEGENLCFVAYARVNGGTIALNNSKKSGINDGYNNPQITKDIKRIIAQENCFKVILLQHWGEENKPLPRQREVDGAKYYHSIGVDIVVGSHPHVVQPVYLRHNQLTAYSLGNFLFYSTNLSNRTSTILEVHIEIATGKITYQMIPVILDIKTGFPHLVQSTKFKQ